MAKIKKIGVMSFAKISAALYGIVGFILGVIMSLISIIAGSTISEEGGMFGALLGVGAIIFFPIIYGVLGLIGGLITGCLYNLASSIVGGLEVEVEQ